MNWAVSSIAVLALCSAANSQPAAEFEVASIKASAPESGHFRAPGSGKGGPGTADPGRFTCTNCTLSYLIGRAFGLERYQFPGQSSLPGDAFDVSAKVPEGATPEQFAGMLQTLLKDRFGLTYHLDTKQVQGYEMVVAKNGSKLKEASAAAPPAPAAGDGGGHGGWGGEHDSSRPGFFVFRGQARYRGDGQTTAELARMIAAQLARPVDDRTNLTGKYDIVLTWSDDGAHAATHTGGVAGFGGHGDGGDHGGPGAGAAGGGGADTGQGPTLFAALQAQLGLKLEPKKATAKIFIVDHVEKTPTGN
jgi:uncharacterized protein (TIGR03435 family)